MSSSREGISRCKIIRHITDGIWLSVILMIQGTIMNYYIINHYSASVTPYLLFVADFLVLTTFIGTLATSYGYLKKVTAVDSSTLRGRGPKLVTSKLGLLPLSYISWLFYVAVLVTKIVIIFESGLVLRLSVKNHLGPQLLKMTMASSGFVFLLLLEGHNLVKRESPRYSYIINVCAKTGIEIFDSVSLLAIIMDEGPSGLPEGFRDFVLGISAFNFFLPSIKLYQLSFPDATIDRRRPSIDVLYYFCHLFAVDVPFLVIRLWLWLGYRQNASMFLMKNILSIVLTLRGMYPNLVMVYQRYTTSKRTAKRSTSQAEFEEISLNTKEKGDSNDVSHL